MQAEEAAHVCWECKGRWKGRSFGDCEVRACLPNPRQNHAQRLIMKPRHDFYQTPTTVIASLFLKKVNKEKAKIEFSSPTEIKLDLPTMDNKRYNTIIPLSGQIDTEKSTFKVMGTKLELTLVKLDGAGWPTLRSDEQRTSEIMQIGPAGRA